MREVQASRFVQTYPAVVEDVLSPDLILEAEGSFTVRDIDQSRVTVGGYGLELVFEFTHHENELVYEQVEGPLDRLRTTLSYGPENEGTRLTARSEVAVGGPGVLDRLAAWKRQGELERALAGIAEQCQ